VCRADRTGFFRFCRQCGYDFEPDLRGLRHEAVPAARFEEPRPHDREDADILTLDTDDTGRTSLIAGVVAVVLASAIAAFLAAYALGSAVGR
jgi:hypothetical protein